MSVNNHYTEEQLKDLMLKNAHLSRPEFCAQFHIGAETYSHLLAKNRREILEARQKMKASEDNLVNGKQWVTNKNYTYNGDTDTYITFIKSKPSPIVLAGDTHRAMQTAYSNWDGNPSTINEICRQFSFPRPWFIDYKTVHGWTHDKEPFTTEEVLERPVDDLVQDALEQKRGVIFQKFEQEKWKQTQSDADKYRKLLQGDLTPFNIAMLEWEPLKSFTLPKTPDEDTFSFIVAATDWQIGLKAIEENLTLGKDWDVNIGRKVLENYLEQIYKDIHRFKVNWDKCYLFNLGDLPHGFYGFTETRRHPLVMDVTRKQQYDAVFSLQTFFIEGLYQVFGNLEEVGVAGNHEGAFGWYVVSRALQERYAHTPNIIISAHTKQLVYKRVGNVLFILTHGADPNGYGAKYPVGDGKGREAAIQKDILYVTQELQKSNPRALDGIVQTVFIQGDRHSYHQSEKGTYEDMQFGSPSLGDDYSDSLRLNSRPSQNCLLVSHKYGVKAPLRYYFDIEEFTK